MKNLLPVVLLVVLSACASKFQMAQVVVGDVIQEMDSTGGEAIEEPLIESEVVVTIHAPPVGVLMANSGDATRSYTYLPFPEAPAHLEGLDRMAFYEAFYAGLAESQGTTVVLQLVDVGPTLSVALERHLGRHFRSARIELVEDRALAQNEGFIVSVQGHAEMFFTKSAAIQLVTESGPAQLPPFEGHGVRRSGRHLGWAIPVVLIGGLMVGALIVSPILSSIARRHIRESWALAFDDAAAQWAAGVARAWRSQNGFAPVLQAAPVAQAPSTTSVPSAPTERATPVACDANARCDSGFICHEGMCLSACNPDCATNEVCVGSGECVSACNPPCQTDTTCTAQRECVVL